MRIRSLSLLLCATVLSSTPLYAAPLPSDEARSLHSKGIRDYYDGFIEEAVDKQTRATVVDPSFIPARLELISLYKELGDSDKAQAVASSLYSIDPFNNRYRKEYFIAAVQNADYDAAKPLADSPGADAETLFYRGYYFMMIKKYDDAHAAMDEAILADTHMPQAHFFKGLMFEDKGKYEEAEVAFSACLKIEPNFTAAFYPLGRVLYKLDRYDRATTFLGRARSNLPEDKEIQSLLTKVLKKNKHKEAENRIKRETRQKSIDMPKVDVFPPRAGGVTVRIGLVERANSFSMKMSADYTITAGVASYRGGADDYLTVTRKASGVEIADASGMVVFASNAARLDFTYDHNRGVTAVFNMSTGTGYYFASTVDRFYRGGMRILNVPTGLTLINVLELEEYLYSVVPSEVPSTWPKQALMAQAVAARTYTLAGMGTFASRGFDMHGSIISHAYVGLKGEHPATTAAVNATAARALYDSAGKLLVSYYSANTGGYTEDGLFVWPNGNVVANSRHRPVPDIKEQKRKEPQSLHELSEWIKARPLTYSSWPGFFFPSAFRSALFLSEKEATLRMSRQTKTLGSPVAYISRGRGISGRVATLGVVGTEASTLLQGDVIRNRAGGLRSNLFYVEQIKDKKGRPAYFVIHTAGWGHGVGMDQSGAAGMAAGGYSYTAILSHYYPTARLRRYLGAEKS